MLELHPEHVLATNYQVTVDGAALTRVYDTYGPLAATFDWNGTRYRVDPRREPGGVLATIGRAIVQSVTGTRAWTLAVVGQLPLATACERGFRQQGFDLEVGTARAALDPPPGGSGFVWRGPDGEGRIERLGYRGVRATLPASLAPPLQVFVALLALSTWETVSTGGGD